LILFRLLPLAMPAPPPLRRSYPPALRRCRCSRALGIRLPWFGFLRPRWAAHQFIPTDTMHCRLLMRCHCLAKHGFVSVRLIPVAHVRRSGASVTLPAFTQPADESKIWLVSHCRCHDVAWVFRPASEKRAGKLPVAAGSRLPNSLSLDNLPAFRRILIQRSPRCIPPSREHVRTSRPSRLVR